MEKNTLQLLSKYKGPIMGFAAWCIVLFHEWQLVFAEVPVVGLLESGLKRIGFFGVDIFFLLSGLGLTYAIKKGTLLSFYWRRIKRLLIPFVAVGLLRFCLEDWTLSRLWQDLSGYSFYTRDIYAFLWFIPAICALYLLFPLYYKLFERAGDKIAFTLGALAIWFWISILGIIRYDAYGFTNRIPVFLIGVLIGWWTQHKTLVFKKSTWGCLWLFLVFGLYLSHLVGVKGAYLIVPASNCFLPPSLLAISVSFLLAKGLEQIHETLVGKGLIRFFGFFGLFSLEFYCVQEWLGGLLIPMLQKSLPLFWVNMVTLSAICAVSFGLYLFQKYIWKAAEWMVQKCRI